MKRPLVIGSVVLLVALAVAGGVIWYGKRGKPQAKPEAPKAEPTAPERPHGGGGGGEDRAPSSEPNVLVDDDPEGALRLEGLVVDAHDQPVAGAEVTVSSNPPRTVKSDDGGSFFFDKLVGRAYVLVARAPAGVAGPVEARLTAKSDPVTLHLAPGAAVEVTVVTAADRKPVAHAKVELRDVAPIAAETGADGKARIDGVVPGGYDLVASAPGYAKAHHWMNVGRGGGAQAVVEHETVELRKGAPVAGSVRTPDGKPVAGALVYYGGASEWSQQADPRLDGVTTDEHGAFRFEGLGAGTYRFAARQEDFAPGTSPLVTLDGEDEKTGVDIQLEPAAIVAGKVVSKGGAPVASATVRVSARVEGWSFEDARQTFTDDQGAFEMRGLPRKKLDLAATHETGASETATVDATAQPEKRDLVLTIEIDGRIAGTVVDAKGDPVADADVAAMPDLRKGGAERLGRMEWRLRGSSSVTTDAGGGFAIVGLRDGDYVLRANRPGAMRGFMRDPTEAKVGDEHVKIVLEDDGGLTGKVAFADGHAPETYVVSIGFGSVTPFSASDGKFDLQGVPPGERTLTISGPSFDKKSVPVTIEAGKTADAGTVTVERGRTISGRVLTADGTPVPGATVYAGRRLFGNGAHPGGGGGMGGRGAGTKTATSDDTGAYTLYGVGPRDLAVVAEHETLGRSTTVSVPGSDQPSNVDLILAPFASLQGTVTKAGAPVEGVGVNVTSQNVPTTNFVVQTGPDGAFRFDHLAPDVYLVQSVSGGRMAMMGMSFHTTLVTLAAGQNAQVHLEMPAVTTTLTVTAAAEGGTPVSGFIRTAAGPLHSTTAKALEKEVAALGAVASTFNILIMGNPVSVNDVEPGNYTVCVVPFPSEVKGMGPTMDYLEREGENLPVFCVPKTVTDAAGQSVEVPVQIPKFVPAPGVAPPKGKGGT